MPDSSRVKEFPDISKKLSAPSKKSQFEKQREEAEAKRLREEQETAAAYADFVKSFEDDSGGHPPTGPAGGRGDGRLGGFQGGGGLPGARRHFTPASMPRVGGIGSLGPPPSIAKKRAFDERPRLDRERVTRGALGDSDEEEERRGSDQGAERAPPKPTLHLSSMPPGTSTAVIKSLIPAKLKVEGVRILPTTEQGSIERKSTSAIVVLAADTTATDIDSSVSTLQKTYMGKGFNLAISRHVSTNALGLTGVPPPPIHSTGKLSLPFGAKSLHTGAPTGPMNRAPPPGNFAPPSAYGPGQAAAAPAVQVQVSPPSNLDQIKLIHKTVEAVIRNGPEFEALLMNRPDVQREEKWAWIWDPNSAGGIWYRWKLWTLYNQLELDGDHSSDEDELKRLKNPTQKIFEGAAPWVQSVGDLKYEFVDKIQDIVSDSDYTSEDEESDDEETRRRQQNENTTLGEPDGPLYLNPVEKARLTYLLWRLPKTTATLRKGDIARITAFAINHASSGYQEVVDILISNILMPFSWTVANGEINKLDLAEGDDPSNSKLIGLFAVSDILTTSSTASVRHAWRYRAVFETALKERKIFEHLGRLDKDLGWGRMRTDRWKNSVDAVLRRWRDANVFLEELNSHFSNVFTNPPLTDAEKAAEAAANEKEAEAEEEKPKSEQLVQVSEEMESKPPEGDVDGEPMSDLDGEPMSGSDSENDVPEAGHAEASPADMQPEAQTAHTSQTPARPTSEFSMSMKSQKDSGNQKRRPRAEDLFG